MSDGMESSSIESAPEASKKKLDPGFSRNLKIIGGALGVVTVLFFVVFIMGSGGSKEKVNSSNLDLGGATASTPNSQVTPAMAAMIRDQQIAEAKAAAARGSSYIPPDTVGSPEPVFTQPAPVTASTYAQTSLIAPQNAQDVAAIDERRRKGLELQLEMIAGSGEATEVRTRITPTGSGEVRTNAAPASSSSVVTAAAGGSTTKSTQIIAGLDILAASLASDLEVPANATVFASAVVNGGPHSGAYLIGTARVVSESLQISFTQMRLGDKMYTVDAIVLDQGTAANAITGSVDRKLLARYVMPVALAVAQGFYSAKAQTGSTQVTVGTEAAVVTPPSTTEQARSAGIARGLEIGQQEVQKGAQEPIVVSARRNTPVGLLFRAPVTEESK